MGCWRLQDVLVDQQVVVGRSSVMVVIGIVVDLSTVLSYNSLTRVCVLWELLLLTLVVLGIESDVGAFIVWIESRCI